MSTNNLGNQSILYKYNSELKSTEFNTLFKNIISAGIYNGGTIAIDLGNAPNGVILSAFTILINDTTQQYLVKVSTSATISINVSEAKPYLTASYTWNIVPDGNIYLDFTNKSLGEILSTDIIFGKIIYVSGSAYSVDYTESSQINTSVVSGNDIITNFRGLNTLVYPGATSEEASVTKDIRELGSTTGTALNWYQQEQLYTLSRVDNKLEGTTLTYQVPSTISEVAADKIIFTPTVTTLFSGNHKRIGLYLKAVGSGYTNLVIAIHDAANTLINSVLIPIATLSGYSLNAWFYTELVATLAQGTAYHYHLYIDAAGVGPTLGSNGVDQQNVAHRQFYKPQAGDYGTAQDHNIVVLKDRAGNRLVAANGAGADVGYASETIVDVMAVDFSDNTYYTNWVYNNYIGIDLKTGRIKIPTSLDTRNIFAEFNIKDNILNIDAKNILRHNNGTIANTESVDDALRGIRESEYQENLNNFATYNTVFNIDDATLNLPSTWITGMSGICTHYNRGNNNFEQVIVSSNNRLFTRTAASLVWGAWKEFANLNGDIAQNFSAKFQKAVLMALTNGGVEGTLTLTDANKSLINISNAYTLDDGVTIKLRSTGTAVKVKQEGSDGSFNVEYYTGTADDTITVWTSLIKTDPATNRVGINTAPATEALKIGGAALSSLGFKIDSGSSWAYIQGEDGGGEYLSNAVEAGASYTYKYAGSAFRIKHLANATHTVSIDTAVAGSASAAITWNNLITLDCTNGMVNYARGKNTAFPGEINGTLAFKSTTLPPTVKSGVREADGKTWFLTADLDLGLATHNFSKSKTSFDTYQWYRVIQHKDTGAFSYIHAFDTHNNGVLTTLLSDITITQITVSGGGTQAVCLTATTTGLSAAADNGHIVVIKGWVSGTILGRVTAVDPGVSFTISTSGLADGISSGLVGVTFSAYFRIITAHGGWSNIVVDASVEKYTPSPLFCAELNGYYLDINGVPTSSAASAVYRVLGVFYVHAGPLVEYVISYKSGKDKNDNYIKTVPETLATITASIYRFGISSSYERIWGNDYIITDDGANGTRITAVNHLSSGNLNVDTIGGSTTSSESITVLRKNAGTIKYSRVRINIGTSFDILVANNLSFSSDLKPGDYFDIYSQVATPAMTVKNLSGKFEVI